MGSKLPAVRRILFFFFCIAFSSSCSTFDTSEKIPSYIHIDKINFIPGDTSIEGSAATNITDAWVYIDGQPAGVYELPATFPVQLEGTHSYEIAAGIKMNGIAATRVKYPFYDFYNGSVTLEQKKVTTITPSVKLFQGLTFSFIEDFGTQTGAMTDTFAGAVLRPVGAPEAWGGPNGRSVYAKLVGDTIEFQARTLNTFPLLADGHSKYIELNYRCNHAFIVGLTYNGGTGPVVGVNPSETWNKIYINLTDQIILSGNYGIYIAMLRLGNDTEDPYIYFDNLKLIHN